MAKQKQLCVYSVVHTMRQIFLERICVKQLWNHLRLFLASDICLPILTPQVAVFGCINGIESTVYKIAGHILLIFKLHILQSRETGTFALSRLIS